MSKLIAINDCNECPRFDNEYYSYSHMCELLNREMEGNWGVYNIPDDCPLEEA